MGIKTWQKIEMVDLEGKRLKIFIDAREAAKQLNLGLSTIRGMMTQGRGFKKKPYRLRFLVGNIRRKKRDRLGFLVGNIRRKKREEIYMRNLIAERKQYVERLNGKPQNRKCLMCNKIFVSTHKGNRRCGRCNTIAETVSHRICKTFHDRG